MGPEHDDIDDDDELPPSEAPSPKPPRGNPSATTAIEANALDRDSKALALRIAGATFDQISEKLGYGGRANAHRAVHRRLDAMREECKERADQLKSLELHRLDELQVALWKRAKNGDVQAIDRILRILERRSAYEGLDVPRGLKVELTREVEGMLDTIKERCSADVYEQVLTAISGGDLGTPTADGPAPAAGDGGEGAGSGDPGEGQA